MNSWQLALTGAGSVIAGMIAAAIAHRIMNPRSPVANEPKAEEEKPQS